MEDHFNTIALNVLQIINPENGSSFDLKLAPMGRTAKAFPGWRDEGDIGNDSLNPCQVGCVWASGCGCGRGAHAAVSPRPPFSLSRIVARTHTHGAKVWDLSIVQGHFLSPRAKPWRNCFIAV
jgi:hypothetical protein